MKAKILVKRHDTLAGELILGSVGGLLCMCDWACRRNRGAIDGRLMRYYGVEMAEGCSDVVDRAITQLDEYFAGTRREFDVPLDFAGTDFQRRVWAALCDIGYGRTMTYGELARRLGCIAGVRAVASAVGANALSIFVPCHRVVGADGGLTGYAGGLEAKKVLLGIEGVSVGS